MGYGVVCRPSAASCGPWSLSPRPAMSKHSLDRFLALVERSRLVEPPDLASASENWKRHATLAELDDATPCAEHLTEIGLLTRWQARKLLEGRHRGFFLGNY